MVSVCQQPLNSNPLAFEFELYLDVPASRLEGLNQILVGFNHQKLYIWEREDNAVDGDGENKCGNVVRLQEVREVLNKCRKNNGRQWWQQPFNGQRSREGDRMPKKRRD